MSFRIGILLEPYYIPPVVEQDGAQKMGEIVEFYDNDDNLLFSLTMTAIPVRNMRINLLDEDKWARVDRVELDVADDQSPIYKVFLNRLRDV